MAKRKIPASGHFGMYGAKTAERAEEMIREQYIIPKGAKIVKTFMYSDPPVKIYDCEVIINKKINKEIK